MVAVFWVFCFTFVQHLHVLQPSLPQTLILLLFHDSTELLETSGPGEPPASLQSGQFSMSTTGRLVLRKKHLLFTQYFIEWRRV